VSRPGIAALAETYHEAVPREHSQTVDHFDIVSLLVVSPLQVYWRVGRGRGFRLQLCQSRISKLSLVNISKMLIIPVL
jgi:hypothetical protein